MKIRHLIIALLIFGVNASFAQTVKFTASVSKTTVGTGEQFQIEFSLNGNGGQFTPPDLSNFQVLSGPNVSTSMESVNGNTTMSNSYSYILMPFKEGDFTIGPAAVISDGRKLTTNAIKIKVVKGHPVQQGNQAQGGLGQDNSTSPAASADLSKSLFIKAVVNKTNVYLGEQLTVTYRLFTRVDIEQSQVDKLPDLNGFFGVDTRNMQQAVQFHIETYKGLKYNVADIKQTVLFPEHAGNLTIDPFAMTFIARQPVHSDDIMGQFFGSYNEVKVKVKSTPVVIHVKSLPEIGKPASFTGAVGNFNIQSSIDKTEVKANDALNYKVKVTGSGNIQLLKTLSTSFPADFEKYDPKITDSLTQNENGVAGTRIYNYLLIPRHEGDFTIDPLSFSYFNPATGRYVTLASKSFHVKVDKGAGGSNVAVLSGADKQDVKMLDKDIRYIKTDGDLSNSQNRFFGSIWYYILILLGPVACYGAFVYRNRIRKQNSDVVQVKSKRAGKVAAKHLASAQKQLLANNPKAFYEDISKGLYGYLSDKLNIQYANLDREIIIDALKKRLVSEQLTTQLLDTLDLCEMARYAPVTHISEKEVFEKAKGIINDIENEI